MKTVYVLQHSHELDGCDETAMIGVYSSEQMALAAIERLCHQPGFKEYPGCFFIDPYQLDEDHWVEGFVIVSYEEAPSED